AATGQRNDVVHGGGQFRLSISVPAPAHQAAIRAQSDSEKVTSINRHDIRRLRWNVRLAIISTPRDDGAISAKRDAMVTASSDADTIGRARRHIVLVPEIPAPGQHLAVGPQSEAVRQT